MRWSRIAGTIVVGGVLSGCVGIATEMLDEGIVYNLPRTLLTITVVQYTDEEAGRTWYQIGAKPQSQQSGNDGTELAALGDIESRSIPDPGHRYVAKYMPSPIHDDRLCVSRSPTGLLQDVNFASDDRTSEVVFNIARFIAGSIGGPRKTGITSKTGTALAVRAYTGRVDPLNKTDVTAFNDAMSEVFGEDVSLDMGRMIHTFREHTAELPTGCRFGEHCDPQAWTDRCMSDNICYRTQLEVPIDLMRGGQRVDVNYAKVINPWDIGAISATRSFLVHKISKFKFDNGVLIGAVIRKPSEVEEASLLPLHVVYAALHTPSAALATAFSTDDGAKADVADELNTLTQKVNQNTTALANIQEGLSPGISANEDTQVYQLTCGAPKPKSGDVINVVTGGNF